jgi:5-keto 4-deoxyuronate isomerase
VHPWFLHLVFERRRSRNAHKAIPPVWSIHRSMRAKRSTVVSACDIQAPSGVQMLAWQSSESIHVHPWFLHLVFERRQSRNAHKAIPPVWSIHRSMRAKRSTVVSACDIQAPPGVQMLAWQ